MLYMLGKENIQNCGPQMGLEDMGICSWGGEYCLRGLGEVVIGDTEQDLWGGPGYRRIRTVPGRKGQMIYLSAHCV